MKKQWTSPRILVQEFEANEYVAACWAVGCDTGVANQWEQDNHEWWQIKPYHDPNDCGVSSHQVLRDTNNDGIIDEMVETKAFYDPTCSLYSDGNYALPILPSDIHPDKNPTIYWTTKYLGTTYHHQGKVFGTDPDHPNRS